MCKPVCIHAKKEPAGCGTTEFCSTCGAAIAIVSSFAENRSVERVCALSARRGDGRGLGTYSMKMFGEKVLKGRVSFSSSPEEGTIFRFSLPFRE